MRGNLLQRFRCFSENPPVKPVALIWRFRHDPHRRYRVTVYADNNTIPK